MSHRVLAGEIERLGRDIDREDRDFAIRASVPEGHGQRDGDRPAARPDVDDRSGGDPAGRAADRESTHDLGLREVHETFRLGSRDEGARIDAEGEPVELLDAPDVGHRLPARDPTLQVGPEPRLVVRAHWRIGVREDDRAVHPDHVPQQQFRIKPR